MKQGDRLTLDEIIRQYNNKLDESDPIEAKVLALKQELSYWEGQLEDLQTELKRLDTLRNAVSGADRITCYETFEKRYNENPIN